MFFAQKMCTESDVSDWRHLIAALGVTCRAGGGTQCGM